MFHFDSNTTVPLQRAALVFLGYIWLTVPWDPDKISFQTLIKIIT